MLTGALTACGYDSDHDFGPDTNYGVELDSDCDSDIHVDIDYAYGLGDFGYVNFGDRLSCGVPGGTVLEDSQHGVGGVLRDGIH
jgi:hypothetical protein